MLRYRKAAATPCSASGTPGKAWADTAPKDASGAAFTWTAGGEPGGEFSSPAGRSPARTAGVGSSAALVWAMEAQSRMAHVLLMMWLNVGAKISPLLDLVKICSERTIRTELVSRPITTNVIRFFCHEYYSDTRQLAAFILMIGPYEYFISREGNMHTGYKYNYAERVTYRQS
jgi:hypothetical protein